MELPGCLMTAAAVPQLPLCSLESLRSTPVLHRIVLQGQSEQDVLLP